jgi:hypothetical protein
MADLTDTEAFGTGLDFDRTWDLVTSSSGSFGQVSGLAVLKRDLAFALQQATRERDLRGRRFNADLREDVRILLQNVATEMDRIERLVDATIIQPDDARRVAEVQLTVDALDGARGAFVFLV